jgi:hypothetical protein
MSIIVKNNEKPKMPVCKMNCDIPLHEKLDKYDMTKYLNCHQSTLIIGKPQSGKTSFLYSLFKSKHLLKKVYDKVFLFQPHQSRASMKDNIFGQLPEDQLYDELTLENLDDMTSKLDENCNALIMDDMTAYLKNKEVAKKLREILFNRRHLHISVFFLVQNYYSVPRDIRKVFNNLIVFRCSKMEMKTIFDEVIESKKDNMLDVMKLVYDKPHQYLFVNLESQRMFKDFDEMILEED